MKLLLRHKKKIAIFLSALLFSETFYPQQAVALTSGPVQPEMKGFEPAGTSQMVDLFTGDFKYNIPLMDVGGYPLNLVYHAGSGIEDEASWVGFGWSLTPGSINRQLRGLPDDFDGTSTTTGNIGDSVTRIMSRLPEVRAGLGVSVKGEFLGIPGKKLKISGKVSAELYNDNYWGIGAQIGANAGLSFGIAGAGKLTANLGITTDSHSGVDVTPTLNFSVYSNGLDSKGVFLGRSVGFPYNSRAGLRGLTLGQSFGYYNFQEGGAIVGTSHNSYMSFAGQAYTPQITMPTKTTSYTASIDFGPSGAGIYVGAGVTGSYFKSALYKNQLKSPAYGYLYADKGKNDLAALMDMNREKDGPFIKEDPYLPIPVNTYDLFTESNQEEVSQFRLMRGSTGILFDPQQRSISSNNTFGAEFGVGAYFQAGADLYKQTVNESTGKWVKGNNYQAYADYSSQDDNHIEREPAYFKKVGENTPADEAYENLLYKDATLRVAVSKNGDDARADAGLKDKDGRIYPVTGPLERTKRDIRDNSISYLTAAEASRYALYNDIYSYPYNQLIVGSCTTTSPTPIDRTSSNRNAHHISVITSTDEAGKRFVYGIPVYNNKQEEVTFSTGSGSSANRASGRIGYTAAGTHPDNSIHNSKGRDHYFSKESLPPYATSYLLTAILSPDYIDKTGDGITDDDPGTATKFNYTRITENYKWRSPYDKNANVAAYNQGMLSDTKDDKASYVYGEKELWYLHSIESKTMIAQFILENRADGLGVAGENGGKSTAVHQKLLKEIRLYSKSDLANQGSLNTAIPIKTVHFVYTYNICRGVPNASGGKLTLSKVYFTFGNDNKGKLHPYIFDYNDSDPGSTTNRYQLQAYDRWGTYKDSASNPAGLLNSEYPYTLQDSVQAASNAAKWQLDKITLPTGGVIHVTYESDDYAYVQNKRAMQMFRLKSVNGSATGNGLINASSIEVSLPDGITDISQLTEGIDYIYFKCLVSLDNQHQEYVPGYAKVKRFALSPDKKTLTIKFDVDAGHPNPIAKTAWQFFRTNLPQYVYPGYENMSPDESNAKKAILALKGAISNLKELTRSFTARARSRGYANKLVPAKSWVRLCAPFYKKLGGGGRVKKVVMNDQWQTMSGAAGAISSAYGQEYAYTASLKTIQGTRQISSGVASYEPLLGNDENPFRQPVLYRQNIPMALTNYYYKELPVCESYFPAPVVGYSKVTVRNIGADGSTDRTGYTMHTFYTAKDFPAIVKSTPVKLKTIQSSFILRFIGAEAKNSVAATQGYSVELNDMHGKPESVAVYDQGGGKISGITYEYQTADPFAESKQLNNNVQVLNSDGTIDNKPLAQHIDMVSDMRREETENVGKSYQASVGLIAVAFFPIPFGFPGVGKNNGYKTYHSASTVKVIHKYGILKKVTKMQSGSTISTENLVWDAETGHVLLTKIQNEFDDPVYSFTYPAHWAYPGMGQAYQNAGMYITNFSTSGYGIVNINGTSSGVSQYLSPGDELIETGGNNRIWISENSSGQLIAIDRSGNYVSYSGTVKVDRSGKRNMASIPIGAFTSLVNPIKNNKLDISSMSHILNAQSYTYDDTWPVQPPCVVDCDPGYDLSPDGTFCYKDVPATLVDNYIVYATSSSDNYSIYGSYLYDPGYCKDGVTNFTRHRMAPSNPYWVGDIDCCSISGSANGVCTQSVTNNVNSLPVGKISISDSSGKLQAKGTTILSPLDGPSNKGPLNRSGIWTCSSGTCAPAGKWIGVAKYVYFPESKTYYFGMGGDNKYKAAVDGNYFIIKNGTGYEDFCAWHIYPLFVTKGYHHVSVEGYNIDQRASIGMEVYNNTPAELEAASVANPPDILFSTRDFVGQYFTTDYSCPLGSTAFSEDGIIGCRYTYQHPQYINPYIEGLLGNWRVRKKYVYQVSRHPYDTTLASNIREAGYYTSFSPFWIPQYGENPAVSNEAGWTMSSEITHYSKQGMETEEKDALGRYSSALFGFGGTLPVMVSSNAMERETLFEGFEDFIFNSSCQIPCKPVTHFGFETLVQQQTANIVYGLSHTGNYCLKLNGTNTLTIPLLGNTGGDLYTLDPYGRTMLEANGLIPGFSPEPGHRYLISFWIKEGNEDPSTGFQLKVNDDDLLASNVQYPVVEGWKKIEASFGTPGGTALDFQLSFSPAGSNTYIDDIRIIPYDGEGKSFVYDARWQRLMAGLDENNFATLYEYDDEGKLVRVKKETEKGIVTLKENRSAYQISNP